ncbi:hypothetical protein LshimejAT787_0409450 [Lyophyllum shimeji]|uniref:Uncharacterized protein n=1 Tax=Lyophyllum shimeji TaxID=47721 RepID=A0A9P3PLY5_LYOSH|nr:hypothetical protein LshimejAT787_0409450 [Lyophyllum shimeji]
MTLDVVGLHPSTTLPGELGDCGGKFACLYCAGTHRRRAARSWRQRVSHFFEMYPRGRHSAPSWEIMTPEEVVFSDALQAGEEDDPDEDIARTSSLLDI